MEKESHRKLRGNHKTKSVVIVTRKFRILGTVVASCGVVICLVLLSKVDQVILDRDTIAKRGKVLSIHVLEILRIEGALL